MRAELEEAFDMDALDSYGLSEGSVLASRASAETGMASTFGRIISPEIIDPATGAVLPDGAFGIVFTSLTKEAMPSSATGPAISRVSCLTALDAADGKISAERTT
jgi:phenylacetate-CoA ligase